MDSTHSLRFSPVLVPTGHGAGTAVGRHPIL